MKWRFITALSLVTLLVLLVQDIPLGFYLQQVEHDRIITGLERDAFVLAGRGEQALESPGTSGELTALAKQYRDAGGARVVIVDANGTVIAMSDDDQAKVGTSFANRPEIAEALTGQISTGHRFSTSLNQELLYVTVPVLNGSQVLGAVRLTYPDAVVTDTVNGQLGLLSLVALIAVILAGIVGYIVALTLTRRIRLLQDVTERFARGDLGQRAESDKGPVELTSLARSFNDMADQLTTVLDQQKKFAADASHQLRTPLTALRLRLERAQDLIATDPQGAAERLAAAEAETVRLSNLIEGLLALSRAEAQTANLEERDLADVARQRAEHWQALAAESSVTVSCEAPATALVYTAPGALEQIIDNYVDNALTVSPKKSRIVIRVGVAGSVTTVHVLDEGPGLSAADRKRAFDRFWRGSSDEKGSGLGLAIVAQLATASGGHAWLSSRTDKGLDAAASFSTVELR